MPEQPSIATAISEPTDVIGPTTPKERLQVIDMVRGWAIFGILVVNMLRFSGYFPFQEDWTGSLDQAVVWSIQFFFRMKFVTLFTVLFGLGVSLQMTRAESKGINFLPLYLRRLSILLLFGFLHVLLGSPTEVLHQYALVGALLLLFRSRSNATMLVTGVFFLLLPFVFQVVAPGAGPAWPPAPDVSAYSEGSIGEIGAFHMGQFLEQRASPVGYVWMLQLLPLFLLGFYVGKRRILEDVAVHLPLIRKSLWWGLALGLGLTSMATVVGSSSNPAWAQWAFLVAGVAFMGGAVGLSLFYASSIVLLAQREKWRRRLVPLAAVGRMALTNYLLQTLLSASIFFGYGLGLYGTMGATAGLALTIIVFAFQVVFSVWWMGHFRFGPAEWLWRTLTYGKLQPMRAIASS